jgi:hypothetical protein
MTAEADVPSGLIPDEARKPLLDDTLFPGIVAALGGLAPRH